MTKFQAIWWEQKWHEKFLDNNFKEEVGCLPLSLFPYSAGYLVDEDDTGAVAGEGRSQPPPQEAVYQSPGQQSNKAKETQPLDQHSEQNHSKREINFQFA